MSDGVVTVRRQWHSWEQATFHVEDIDGLHWSVISGGVRAPSPRPFLHGYVRCDAMIDGHLAHSCQHGAGPHRIKVCIVKRDNDPSEFRRLAELAGGEEPVLAELRKSRVAQATARMQKEARLAELLKDPEMRAKSDLSLARRVGLRVKRVAELRRER